MLIARPQLTWAKTCPARVTGTRPPWSLCLSAGLCPQKSKPRTQTSPFSGQPDTVRWGRRPAKAGATLLPLISRDLTMRETPTETQRAKQDGARLSGTRASKGDRGPREEGRGRPPGGAMGSRASGQCLCPAGRCRPRGTFWGQRQGPSPSCPHSAARPPAEGGPAAGLRRSQPRCSRPARGPPLSPGCRGD